MESFDRGDGVCIYLQGNLCSVYDMRPNICNAEYMFQHYFSKKMSRAEFERESVASCEKIKAKFNTAKGKFNG